MKPTPSTRLATLIIAMLSVPVAIAQTSESAVRDCRNITDPARRLACYDAIQAAPIGAPQAAPAPAAPRIPDTPAAAGSAPRGATAATPSRPAPQPSEFAAAGRSLESSLVGRFEGWQPGDRIQLANGQVWQINDNSYGTLNVVNPKVKIVPGMLGSFFLEVEGTTRRPRVVRVR